MRHAKAERVPGKSDFDRALVERGRNEGDRVAADFAAAGVRPDRILCSSSRRTRETLALVLPHLAADCVAELRRDLYDADAHDLWRAFNGTEGACVLVIGHNPAIHELAMSLAASDPEAPTFGGGFPTSNAALFAISDESDKARFERLFTR